MPASPLLWGFILFLLIFLFLPLFPRLTVRDCRSDALLLSLPLTKGEEFSIRYTHSVNLSPVTDTVLFDGQEFILQRTLFTAYGWGMPVLADGIGTSFENTPDGFLISGIDRHQENIPILLQEVPDHHVLYRSREISLLALSGSGQFIRIAGENTGLFSILAEAIRRSFTPGT